MVNSSYLKERQHVEDLEVDGLEFMDWIRPLHDMDL